MRIGAFFCVDASIAYGAIIFPASPQL